MNVSRCFVLFFFLFAFLCIHLTPNSLRECHRAGNFAITLLLRTTRMRSQLFGRVSGVAILQTNKRTKRTTHIEYVFSTSQED